MLSHSQMRWRRAGTVEGRTCCRQTWWRSSSRTIARFSHRDDVTLANPLGPPARGWDQVEKTLDRSVPQMRDGEPIRFERIVEYADGNLAYILEFERWRGKAGSSDQIVPMALRVTTIFRREDGVWKIALRQADPITTPRPIESVRDQEG